MKSAAFLPEIFPLIGLGNLKFGTHYKEALTLFGEPDEREELRDKLIDDHSLVFHYWLQGFSLFFNKKSNYEFTSVEIDNKDALLFGIQVFNLNEKEVIELFEKNGYKMTDSENHEWGEKRISFDDVYVDIYFENDTLQSINYGCSENDGSFSYFAN